MSAAPAPAQLDPAPVTDAASFAAAVDADATVMADMQALLVLLTQCNGNTNLVGPSALA